MLSEKIKSILSVSIIFSVTSENDFFLGNKKTNDICNERKSQTSE